MPSETDAAVEKIIALARDNRKHKQDAHQAADWPEPKPLPSGLAPVESLSPDFLPDALHHGLRTSQTGCSARLTMSRWQRSHRSAPLLAAASASGLKLRPIGSKFRMCGVPSSGVLDS